MLDGWGGDSRQWDDEESDDCYTGWHGNETESEERWKRYQEELEHDNRKKYYMPEYPSY